MTRTDWHAEADDLARLANDPDSIDAITASSLEAHLLGCDTCRQTMAAVSDRSLIETSWAAVADRIDRPRVGFAERALRRLGIGDSWARLLAATAGLQASGLAAIAILAAFAAALSRYTAAEFPFLVITPVIPLAAVAASFAVASDPAGEAGVGTPLHGFGLMARRAVVVLAVTFAVLGLAAVALADLGGESAAWVLPALALAVSALALGTWVRIETAFATLGTAWLLTVSLVWRLDLQHLLDLRSPEFMVATQTVALAMTVLALVVITVRRDRFATLEVFR